MELIAVTRLLKDLLAGVREIAQCLKEVVGLVEVSGLVASIHIRRLTNV